jgi:hypothetical protein
MDEMFAKVNSVGLREGGSGAGEQQTPQAQQETKAKAHGTSLDGLVVSAA